MSEIRYQNFRGSGFITRFETQFPKYIHFYTRKDYQNFGPNNAQDADMIAVLTECGAPVLLRRVMTSIVLSGCVLCLVRSD